MTGKHMDEEIRRIINQVEQQEECNNQNIYEGLTINDVYYEFGERAFFEDKFKIHIPTNFVDMPLELARFKYPSSDRPQVIKTNDAGNINITLNLIPNNICDEHIPEVKEGIKHILKRLNPSYLFLGDGITVIQEKTVGFFEFKSSTIDISLYNLMFFVELKHNVIMGCFNCAYDDHLLWQPVAHQIMQSIKVSLEPLEEADIKK